MIVVQHRARKFTACRVNEVKRDKGKTGKQALGISICSQVFIRRDLDRGEVQPLRWLPYREALKLRQLDLIKLRQLDLNQLIFAPSESLIITTIFM